MENKNRRNHRQSGNGAESALDIEARLVGHIPSPNNTAAWGRSYAQTDAGTFPLGVAGRTALVVAGDLRFAMANAAAQAAEAVRRRTRRAVAATLAIMLSLGGVVVPAAALVVDPSPSFGGFEIDGNMTEDANVAGTIDWANAGDLTIVADDSGDSGFTQGSKELDPGDWVCVNHAGGYTPAKDNLVRAYVNTRIGGSTSYLDLAFIKERGEGDNHINFEFNRSGVVQEDGEGPCPIQRAEDDLLFTYDFGGTNDPVSVVRVWRWDGSVWIELALPKGAAAAANNGDDIPDPLNDDAVIPARSFGELSVDLSKIPGFTPSCPGLGFVNVRSRASGEAINAALKDKMPTTAVDLSTCGSIKLKKVDDKGVALAGVVFGLYKGTPRTLVSTCTSGADGVCSFPSVDPGTYVIKEIAGLAGYAPNITEIPVTVAFRQDVDLTGEAVVNPLILGGVKVLKTNDADNKPVAGIRFQLLQDGTAARTRSGDAAECTTALVAATANTGVEASCTIAGLVPGTYTLHEDPATVPATMTAVDDRTVVVKGGETFAVDVANPVKPLNILLVKLVDGQEEATIHAGDTVTYTLSATNTGSVPIDVFSLVDNNGAPVDLPSICDTLVDDSIFIEPGATQALCTYTAQPTKDVVNTAVVVGVDAFGRKATSTDKAKVLVINPAITIVKTGSVASIVGTSGPVTFTYLVTNTGDTTLFDVAVTDDILGAIGTIVRLAVGESVTLTKAATVSQTRPENIGKASGTDVLGKIVEDTDNEVITFVRGETFVRPLPETPPAPAPAPAVVEPPAPAPAPAPLARTGTSTDRSIQVALFLIVVGGMAVLPERIRRRRLQG